MAVTINHDQYQVHSIDLLFTGIHYWNIFFDETHKKYWRKRLSEIAQKKHIQQKSFVPIRINPEEESGVMAESGFEIVFPNGVVVRSKGSIDHSALSAIASIGT